ncbi:hypothetical protein CDV31_013375 [Fusarium ambrosium]|uniref:Uncharacterized protein n=1 Tax=Fusarium ambrosium TaxID=131363 RepID=A0A428T3N4_9HYPO|nr:hypothetical protein CDV31_013375 [Fusarium ambrosium]
MTDRRGLNGGDGPRNGRVQIKVPVNLHDKPSGAWRVPFRLSLVMQGSRGRTCNGQSRPGPPPVSSSSTELAPQAGTD